MEKERRKGSILGFFHFRELSVMSSSGVDMIAEPNVMLAGSPCHKAEDYVSMQRRWGWRLRFGLPTGELWGEFKEGIIAAWPLVPLKANSNFLY